MGAILQEVSVFIDNYTMKTRKSQLAAQHNQQKLEEAQKKPGRKTRRVEQGGFTSGRRRTPKDPINI